MHLYAYTYNRQAHTCALTRACAILTQRILNPASSPRQIPIVSYVPLQVRLLSVPQTSNLVLVSGSYSAAVARQQAMQSAAGGMVGVRRRMKLLSGKWTWNPALGGSPGLFRSRRGGNVGLTHPEVSLLEHGCVGQRLTEREGGGGKRQAKAFTHTYQQVSTCTSRVACLCAGVVCGQRRSVVVASTSRKYFEQHQQAV